MRRRTARIFYLMGYLALLIAILGIPTAPIATTYGLDTPIQVDDDIVSEKEVYPQDNDMYSFNTIVGFLPQDRDVVTLGSQHNESVDYFASRVTSLKQSEQTWDVPEHYIETFVSPVTGSQYKVFGGIANGVTLYRYKDTNGISYANKSDIFHQEINNLPYDPILLKLDSKLREIVLNGTVSSTVDVLVTLKEQPAHDISMETKAEYKVQFEAIVEQSKNIQQRLGQSLDYEEVLVQMPLSDVIQLEKSLLTKADNDVLEQSRFEVEQKLNEMRQEIRTLSFQISAISRRSMSEVETFHL